MKKFALCLVLCQAALASATEPLIPYSARSSVLQANPIDHDIREVTDGFLRAHLWAAAFLLEMYPNREIYFLGRDAEQLHDVSLLLAQGDPARTSQLHLINVSRAHRQDPHLGDYLRQQGLSSPLNRQILIVDTGSTDKIVNAILGELEPADRKKVVAHYLESSVKWIPSLRIFASWHDHPKEGSASEEVFIYPRLWPQGYESSLLHATETSSRYELINEVWEAVSGELSSSYRAKLGQDKWMFWLSQTSVQVEAQHLRRQFKQLYDDSDSGNRSALLTDLRGFLDHYPRQLAQALLYDYFELRLKSYPNWPGYVGAADFDLPKDIFTGEDDWLRLDDVRLRSKLDSAVDHECYRAMRIFTSNRGRTFESQLIGLFKRCDKDAQAFAAEHIFSRFESVPLQTALRWLIKNGTPEALKKLVENAFSKPHARAWAPEAILIMREAINLQATTEIARKMVDYVFLTRNVVEFQEALEFGLLNGGPLFAKQALQIFAMPWTAGLDALHQLAVAHSKYTPHGTSTPLSPSHHSPQLIDSCEGMLTSTGIVPTSFN